MNKLMKSVVGGVLCWSLVLMAGCSSSKLVDIWNDSSIDTPSLTKMLVISIGKDPVERRRWEDAYCDGFAAHGVDAVPSHRIFPEAFPDTNEVDQAVRSNAFDGILINRRLHSENRPQFVQGYVTNELITKDERRPDKFITYFHTVAHPAYVDSQIVDIRAVDVWMTKDQGQMIWSAASKTPESPIETVKLVLSELTQRGIIAGER